MSSYKDRRILILGLGLNQGGVGSAKFFASQGAKIRVSDLKKEEALKPSLEQLKDFPEIEYTLGEHKNEDIEWADIIIKNPSVKPGNQYIDYAKALSKEIVSDIGIFLEFVKPSQIVGVTGTKGKSTTASLIYEILRQAQDNRNVIFAGNIGKSVLDIIPHIKPETLVILEISSFQLEAFKEKGISPKYAIITNIYPDHLNYYKNMEEYILAKKIIGQYQTKDDFLFIKKGDPIVDQSDFLENLNGQIIRFSKTDLPKIFKSNLLGEHNLENMAAALKVAETFNIPEAQILKTISNFKGVPFRMELLGEFHGIKIINDTTATGPAAGIKALETYPNSILIAGGMNKNMPYDEYVKALEKYAKAVFFLEGDSTDVILLSLRGAKRRGNLITYGPYKDLEKLLLDVKEIAKDGDTILFSPAATSFNLFQNEFDRGRRFNSAVQKVFK